MEPKSVGLLVHSHREDRLEKAQKTLECLNKHGISVFVEEQLAKEMNCDLPILTEAVDVIIALGGDGTLLRAARYAIKWDIPLLGINLGRVGFLTEVEHESLEEALDRLAQGSFEIEERMLLDVIVNKEIPLFAVNDAVISRSGHARLVSVDASVSGDLIGTYMADGLIISSPTGSTGYSLSAGGPIVSPDLECMIISPICARSLQHRPVVVSGKDSVDLKITCDEGISLVLVIDGMAPIEIQSPSHVVVRKAATKLRLVRFDMPHFFDLVRGKLNEWTR